MKEKNILIEKYIDAILIHRNESEGGDYKLANKNYKVAMKCICKLKELDDWVDILINLLEHHEYSVKVNAAYHLLPYKTDLAIKTLKRCSFLPNGEGFNAKMILQEWNNHQLKFPCLEKGKLVYKLND